MLFSGLCLFSPLRFPSTIITWFHHLPSGISIKCSFLFYSVPGNNSTVVWNMCYFLSLECVSNLSCLSRQLGLFVSVLELEPSLTCVNYCLALHYSKHLNPTNNSCGVSRVMGGLLRMLPYLPILEDKCLKNMTDCTDKDMYHVCPT